MSTGDSSVSVPALLKKTEHYDKDERYMATSDLCEVLKRQADNNSHGGGSNDPSPSHQWREVLFGLLSSSGLVLSHFLG